MRIVADFEPDNDAGVLLSAESTAEVASDCPERIHRTVS